MEVSIVICTRNRPSDVPKAVSSVLSCAFFPERELVVIDQSDNDNTELSLSKYRDRITYRHTDTVGLSIARNMGVNLSSGRLIGFTDDDCSVAPDWISWGVKILSESTDVDMCHGQVVASRSYHYREGGIPSLQFRDAYRFSPTQRFRFFGMGANMFIKRERFFQLGGFDELLGAGAPLRSGEDFDLQWRAHRQGFVSMAVPELIVTHHGFRTREEWRDLYARDGFGVGAVFAKHLRCRDSTAFRLLTDTIAREMARSAKGLASRQDTARYSFLTGMVKGLWSGWRTEIDATSRTFNVSSLRS